MARLGCSAPRPDLSVVPTKAEVRARVIDQEFAEANSPNYGARLGNAVQAVVRARPDLTAPDTLAAVRWLLRAG
jgi:hypothetical protein